MAAAVSFREAFFKERESLVKQIKEEQSARLAELPQEALIWQALVPSWTVRLAEAAQFPTGGISSVAETLKRIEAFASNDSATITPTAGTTNEETPSRDEQQDVASVNSTSADDTDADEWSSTYHSFGMPNSLRTDIIQRIIHDVSRGLPYLQQTMMLIGNNLRQVRSSDVAVVPSPVARWADLASMAFNPAELATWLDKKTDELLNKNEPGELLRWIEAARPLEELLGNQLTNSLRRAARLLELHHRLQDDKRRLTKFLADHDQIKAFKDLIDDPAGGWALHYLGSGGMGKTMLIRYLTAHLAPELGASTARIDFDYLNPDYPAHAPGLLLAQLAEELRVHDQTGTASRSFAAFIEKVFNVHERLSTTGSTAQFSLDTVMAPIYAELPLFVDGLSKLPKPIIIILDTCEELAKIRVDGSTPPSVQATFEILERLHQLQPDVRVVFGGRRPLASVGSGWKCPGSDLLPRKYLRVHEIPGFTLAEATRYLTDIEKVPAKTVKLIIDNSLIKNPAPSRLDWNGVGTKKDQTDRYNPFDLSLYATWVHEDPDLPLSTLENVADRYIDMRIVGRLHHADLLNLMPAVALLGRFDFNTVCAVSKLDEKNFEKLFIELSNQEWINRQSSNFLQVDQGLQPRLLDYYQRTKPRQVENVRRAIVDHLEKVTIEEDRAKLDRSHFGSAFRLLKPEPERAAKWWEKVEARFAEEEAYDWLRDICEVIFGEEEEFQNKNDSKIKQGIKGPDLRAAVRASYAAALTHLGPFDKLTTTWGEVRRYAGKHPTKTVAVRLRRRAQAGQVAAAARYDPQGPGSQEIESFWESLNQIKDDDLHPQVAGSLIAAVEALIEFFERRSQKTIPHPGPLVNFSSMLEKSTHNQTLAGFAMALTARLFALSGKWSDADECFRHSILSPGKAIPRQRRQAKVGTQAITESAAELSGAELTPQIWLDWRAPDQLPARLRLEFIRGMYPRYSPAEVLAQVGNNISKPTTIDTDRLCAAILRLRAASGPLDSRQSEELALQSRNSIQQESSCNAHRSFAPLFAVIAEAAAAGGRVDEALSGLMSKSAESENTEQLATVMEADRSCLRIARRMRLRDEDVAASTSVHSSIELEDLALLWAMEGLSNPKKDVPLSIEPLLELAPDSQHRLALLHARFRASYTLRPEMANALVQRATQFMNDERLGPDATFAEVSCFLDALEINQISRWQKLPQPFPKLRIGQVKGTNIWRAKQVRPLERLILQLRHAALDASPTAMANIDTKLVESIGYRRAAKIAMDEGELLALRFPARAARLLNQSYRWHIKAKDFVGALTAKICTALALVQSGQNASFARALKRIEKDFTFVQSGMLIRLPNWESLKATAENPQAKSIDGLASTGWRPWMVRLIACLVWQKEGYRPGYRTQLLARWIRANYGITSGLETPLPAELDGWLTAETRTSPATRSATYLSIVSAKRSNLWHSLGGDTEFFLALQGEDRQVKEKVTVNGLIPYQIATHGLLDQLLVPESQIQPEVLASLASQNVIVLKVDQRASWLCWEGIIGYALQEVGQLDPAQLRFQRTVQDSKTKRAVQWDKVSEVLTWANDLHAAETARSGWQMISEVGRLEIIDSEAVAFRNYNRASQILHVIGAPVETSAGVRLDLSSGRLWRQETRGGGSYDEGFETPYPGGGHLGKGYSSRGDLIKPYDLYALLPNMAVCIVQANPYTSESDGNRNQSDREQAAYLRLIGAELFKLGVPVVITLPTLEPWIAPRVVEVIAQSFLYFHGKPATDPFLLKSWSSKSPTLKRWSTRQAVSAFLSAIGAIQTLVRESAARADDRSEEAFDVCLYAADVKA